MKTLRNYMNQYDISLTGDSGREIARSKDLFYSHTGIILGSNKYSGQIMVFHNHPDSGPSIVTLKNYCNGMRYNFTGKPSDNWNEVLIPLLNSI